jgi:pimeloyl-ACP methyl ester carboxylesterase
MAEDKLSDHYVTVNGIKLHYVRQGAGQPLMLIHGWPGFWYEWHRNIGPLAEHFDVIVPDMARLRLLRQAGGRAAGYH